MRAFGDVDGLGNGEGKEGDPHPARAGAARLECHVCRLVRPANTTRYSSIYFGILTGHSFPKGSFTSKYIVHYFQRSRPNTIKLICNKKIGKIFDENFHTFGFDTISCRLYQYL